MILPQIYNTVSMILRILISRVFMQGLLLHVVQHQPEDPISYFHEEITKLKKEMDETNVHL